MRNKDFAVFILTHGRPDKVITLKNLEKSGYTGRVFIVIDNEDKTAEKYKENFGDKVIMFDKLAVSKTFDTGDNFEDRRAIVYARNVCFQLARERKIKYFIELDDDYTAFDFRVIDTISKPKPASNLNAVLDTFIDYFKKIPAKSIAMSQGGDFIGGIDNGTGLYRFSKRKCMNSFICSTDRPFQFIGRINEDVNTYCRNGSTGDLFLTIPFFSFTQLQTQQNSGGMTELYLDGGTYLKSFYSVMYQPSSVKISVMGQSHRRIHHKICWNNTVPCIIDEKFKKIVKDTKNANMPKSLKKSKKGE